MCSNVLLSIPVVHAEDTEADNKATTAVDRRQAALEFVQASRAYEFGDEEEDLDFLEEEWQLMGTYMSNYYVPYSTYLTSTARDSKGSVSVDKDTKNDYTKILEGTLGMQKDNAEETASRILSNMVDPVSYGKANFKDENKHTTRRLYFGEYDKAGVAKAFKNEVEANYFDLLTMSLDNNAAKKLLKLADSKTDRLAVYWKDGNTNRVVMTINVDFKETDGNGKEVDARSVSSSQAAFLNAFYNASQTNSVANAFFADKGIPKRKDGEDYKDYVNRVYDASMYGWKLYVDTFGNIIADNTDKRYIILPAAMNSAVFKQVKYNKTPQGLQGPRQPDLNPEAMTKDAIEKLDGQSVYIIKEEYKPSDNLPVNNIQSMVYLSNGSMKKGADGQAISNLPTQEWLSTNRDISKSYKDKWYTSLWKSIFSNLDGVAEGKKDLPILRLKSKKDTDSADNVVFDTKNSKAVDNPQEGIDYRLNENLLDQINFKQYKHWRQSLDKMHLISAESNNYNYKHKSVDVTANTLLPEDRRSAILVDVKRNDDNKEAIGPVKQTGWSEVEKSAIPGVDEDLNRWKDIYDKATVLNQSKDGTNALVHFGEGNGVLAKYEGREVDKFISTDGRTYGDAVFPYADNFSRIGLENDFIFVPKSNRKATTTHTAISELALTDKEKLDDVEAEQKNFDLLGKDYNQNLKDLKSTVGENYTGTINSAMLGDAGQALGLRIFSSYTSAALSTLDETYKGDGVIQPPSYALDWEQTPKFNREVDYGVAADKDGSKELEEKISTKKLNQVMDMSFNIMSPTQGMKYVTTWIRNTLNGVFYSWHQDITGSNSSSYTTGKTKYDNQNGFIYQVKLDDLGVTAWLKSNFEHFARFLIIGVLVAMVLYFIRGDLSAQQAIFGFVAFTLLIFVPLPMIDGVISKTNEISSTFYKNKFDYFAIFQLEDYTRHIKDKVVTEGVEEPKEGTTDNTEATGIEKADTSQALDEYEYEKAVSKASNLEAGAGVTVRWMLPKKDNFDGGLRTALNNNLTTSDSFFSKVLSPSVTKDKANEDIKGYADNLYITRQLSDITAYSRTIYGNILGSGQNHQTHDPKIVLEHTSKTIKDPIKKYLSGEEAEDLKGRISKGFTNTPAKTTGTPQERMKHVYGPLLSEQVATGTYVIDTKKITSDTKLGISTTNFNATYSDFNKTPEAFAEGLKRATRDAQTKEEIEKTQNIEVDAKTAAGTSAFALYTESPYYAFAWNFMDLGLSSTTSATGGMKDLLLGSTDGTSNFFYNRIIPEDQQGYNELRDYMDMASLFKVTIPFLNQLNTQYKNYVNKYGTELYRGISLLGPEANGIASTDPDYFKYWHNYNFVRLYNQYSAWVDYLYDADFASPEKIKYAGTEFVVNQPLDPSSYTKTDEQGKTLGRPMVFSESEMKYYGLETGDLTTVERKIQEFNRNTRIAFLPLMNYYSFHDTTMTSIMAITATFEFNKVFSQSKIKGYSLVQEPQGWSLGDFSYDAYMRLILANSTGESLNYIKPDDNGLNSQQGVYEVEADDTDQQMDSTIQLGNSDATGNIYERILAGSGPIIGGMLVLNDVVSVYLLPLVRVIFLVLISLLSIIILVTGVLTTGSTIYKLMANAIFKPIIYAGLLTVGFSMFISLFLGEGSREITGSLTPSIQWGPGGTLLALTLAQVVIIGCMGYLIYKMLLDMKKIGTITLSSVSYVVSSVTSAMTGLGGKLGNANTQSKTTNTTNSFNNTPGSFTTRNNTNNTVQQAQTEMQQHEAADNNARRARNKAQSRVYEKNVQRNANSFEDSMRKGQQKLDEQKQKQDKQQKQPTVVPRTKKTIAENQRGVQIPGVPNQKDK